MKLSITAAICFLFVGSLWLLRAKGPDYQTYEKEQSRIDEIRCQLSNPEITDTIEMNVEGLYIVGVSGPNNGTITVW